MSCWVVPAIAAELWGLPLAQVLAGVADGSIPSQREHGFVFVDVSSQIQPHRTTRKPDGPPPPTYVAVSREPDDSFDEIIAEEFPPTGKVEETIDPLAALSPDPVLDAPDLESSVTVEEDPELPPLCEEEDNKPIAHWRQRRKTVARTRRPPPLAA